MFVIFFPSAGLTKNVIFEERTLTKKEEGQGKYHVSARVIPGQPLYRLEKSSPLTWSNDAQSSSPNWTTKDGNYNWKSGDHKASVNIPLKNNFTLEDKALINLDEIQVEYEDFFPKNPSQFSLEMTVLEEETSTFQKKPPIWKKKIVTPISEQYIFPKIKESPFAGSIKKKNIIYLIKRELGLPFDPSWRFIQDETLAKTHGDHTVFQRRFHMDLRFFEFIDIVFHDSFTDEDLANFRCNFRITHTEAAKNLKLVEHRKLVQGANQILNIKGKKTIRFNIGNFVRDAYKNRHVVFLKEIIIFLPGLADKVIFEQPIQSINFYKNNSITQPITETSLDVSYSRFIKKNIAYLLKHEIGFATPNTWRYSQDKKISVFERSLHKDLHKITSMEFVLNNKISIPKNINCRLRVAFSDQSSPSKTINCKNLSKKIIKINGQRSLRIQLHDLVHQFYAHGKKRVFLEEITFYLTGPINYYIDNQFLKTVRFFTLPDHESHKICYDSSKLCSRTEFLSHTDKRYLVDMTMMNHLIDKKAQLINISLRVKAQNPKSPSGFKVNKARATFRKKNNQLLSNAGKDLVRRWGGPFFDRTKRKELIERVKVNGYYSFQNIDKNAPYETGKSLYPDITFFSSKDALHRLRRNNDGINCDFIFFSKDATLYLELSSVGPFLENRQIELHIKKNGPFNLVPINPLMYWSQSSSKIRFQLIKGTIPKFKIISSSNFSSTVLKDISLLNFKQSSIKSISSLGTRGLVSFEKMEVSGLSPSNQERTVSFSKLNPTPSINHTKVIHSGDVKIITHNSFSRSDLKNSGLVLEGNGKWVEIDWKLDSNLHKDSIFFLKTSKNIDSVISTVIIPFSGGKSLQPIPALLNQPIKLIGLSQKNVDSLKVRLKLHGGQFRLVLKEIALFQPIVASTDQIIDLPSFFHTSFPLTPSKVKNILPSEVSIKKGHLKATLLTNRETSPALEWSTNVNHKFIQPKWLKINYLVSPSIHSNNPCWLKLSFLNLNQEFEKTICTKSYDGEILVPMSNNLAKKSLRSIHWKVQMGNQKKPMPLFLNLDLSMSLYGLSIDTIRKNTLKIPIAEVAGDEILPVFLKDLPENQVAHLGSWWDLGVRSKKPKFDFEKNIHLLASPYLSTHNLFLENTMPTTSLNNLTLEGQNPPNLISPAFQIGIWWQLMIVFAVIMVLGWALNTSKAKKLSHQFFSIALIAFRLSKIEKYPQLYLLLAVTLYFLGLLPLLKTYQSFIYTLGSIILSLASYNLAKLNYYKVVNVFPWSLDKRFIQKETLLTSLFLFFLSTAAIFKMATLDRVAEQAASIGFIMLFTLIFLRVFKSSKKINDLTIPNYKKL